MKTYEVTKRLISMILDMPVEEQEELLLEITEWQNRTKRRYQRQACKKHVAFSSQNRIFGGLIKDFSEYGVFIESKQSFAIGQPLVMTFEVPNSKEQVRITGKIVRTLPNGIGVKFNMLIKDLMNRFVKKGDYESHDPPRLEMQTSKVN